MLTTRSIKFKYLKGRAIKFGIVTGISLIISVYIIITFLILEYPILFVFPIIVTIASHSFKKNLVLYLLGRRDIKRGKVTEEEVYDIVYTLKWIKNRYGHKDT